ncbi:MAG: hypothetical protein HFI58_00190 [Lachnospiraceae bacterium]|nr:hypothetical protein [Lachnospiraceae bacterium]MCI9253248.1 hypothetical protein [Lachnospiraceae bacterium]
MISETITGIVNLAGIIVTIISIIVTMISILQSCKKRKNQKSNRRSPK